MKIEGDSIIFGNGRKIYIFDGIVGINSDLSISYGSDGSINDYGLMQSERLELADFMINRWTAFKNKHADVSVSETVNPKNRR